MMIFGSLLVVAVMIVELCLSVREQSRHEEKMQRLNEIMSLLDERISKIDKDSIRSEIKEEIKNQVI